MNIPRRDAVPYNLRFSPPLLLVFTPLARWWFLGFATHQAICPLPSPCVCTYHALSRDPVTSCQEPRDLGRWGGRRILRENRRCQGINHLAVAGREVDRNWLDSEDKNLCHTVQTSATMKAPRERRTVPMASSANETSLPPRECPFPLL